MTLTCSCGGAVELVECVEEDGQGNFRERYECPRGCGTGDLVVEDGQERKTGILRVRRGPIAGGSSGP